MNYKNKQLKNLCYIMPTKAMSVQMDMFHMAGTSRMRMFTYHPRTLPGLISLA